MRHTSYLAHIDSGMSKLLYCREDGVPWPCDVELRDLEIAALRAALERVVSDPWWQDWPTGANATLDAARAALATAKEAGK